MLNIKTIKKVKEQRNIETDELQGYIVNETIHIPLEHPLIKVIKEWQEAGNQITPAYTYEERLEYFKKHIKKSLNKQKQNEIDNLIIKYGNAVFQADEESQNCAIRAVAIMEDDDVIDWLDVNNNIHTFTKTDLLQAFAQVKDKMTNIVVKYAELKKQLDELQDIESIKDFAKANQIDLQFIQE